MTLMVKGFHLCDYALERKVDKTVVSDIVFLADSPIAIVLNFIPSLPCIVRKGRPRVWS